MLGVLEFVKGHWRMAIALALAIVIYVQHTQVQLLNSKLDTAQANVAKDDALVKQQSQSIQAAKDLADQRAQAAQKIQDAADAAAHRFDASIAWYKAQKVPKGTDRCTAAGALLRKVLNEN